jgi:thiamine biosynthesis protein ThiS
MSEEPLKLVLNGRERSLESLTSPAALDQVLLSLELRADRIAVELNGELAPRKVWPETEVHSGDKLEIVHFVGGGCFKPWP